MKDGKSKEAVDLLYPDTPLLATNGTDLIETKEGAQKTHKISGKFSKNLRR
jgi:hypothetical protein